MLPTSSPRFALLALLALLALPAAAQTELRCDPTELRIRITLTDDRPPGTRLRVELLNSSGNYADQVFTDDEGGAQLVVQRPGNYSLRVTGLNVKDTTGPTFLLRCNQGASFQIMRVPRSDAAEKEVQEIRAREALISAVDMRAPDKAKKEFERGESARMQGNFDEAKKRYESAISIYPEYARAYNSLGVVLTTLGEPAAGVQAWEKAVKLNDRYPDALINLAKVRFNHRDVTAAEELLKKALTADPNNLDALGLLVPAQFMAAEYDDAIATANRVHLTPMHLQYAIVHRIAARALEAQKHPELALEQYTLYLQEAPESRAATEVRAEIARLKNKLGR